MDTVKAVINGTLVAIGLWGHSTCIVTIQFLSVFIWPFSRKLYYTFHAHMMRQWSQNLFQIMNLFAPGELIVTLDESCTREGIDISEEVENEQEEDAKLEHLLTRNKKGQVIGISFPERLIMVSNHQVIDERINNDKQLEGLNLSNLDLCRLDLYLVYCILVQSSWRNENHVET